MAGTTPPRGRIPFGLIGMLALIAGVESLVAQRSDAWNPLSAVEWQATKQAAETESAGRDILCFGDSQVHFAVQPLLLEERLARRTYNLAVSGGQAPSSYFLLRRAIDAGARPRVVLVDFSAGLLTGAPGFNSGLWNELLDPSELFELIGTTRDPRLAIESSGIQLLPSIKERVGIRNAVLAALRDEEDVEGRKRQAVPQHLKEHLGFGWVPRHFKDFPETPWRESDRKHAPPPWRCEQANLVYLRRFMTLAATHDIKVFWLLPPVSPMTQHRHEQNGREPAYERFVHVCQAEFPNVTILDARHLGIDKSLFVDSNHVDCEGSVILTRALGDALARYETVADQSRWVQLPVPLESQSELAQGKTMMPVSR